MTASPVSVVVALGSSLGDRGLNLRRAIHGLDRCMRVVRVSSVIETDAVDAPQGSPAFLNMVVAGYSRLTAEKLMHCLLEIESSLGRRRTVMNAPRTIDLDLIFYSAVVSASSHLTLPHPRYRRRDFVMRPLAELELGWVDPLTQMPLSARN